MSDVETKQWYLPKLSDWALSICCAICREPRPMGALSCARCAEEGKGIWERLTELLAGSEYTLTEVLGGLHLLGYSEGACDGAIEQIEVSGCVEMTEDMDYRKALR